MMNIEIKKNRVIKLTDSLYVPQGTKALLWDMDGVIIDSIDLDFKVCSQLLSRYVEKNVQIHNDVIRKYFALDHKRFWEALIAAVDVKVSSQGFDELLEEYELARLNYNYPLLPGVLEALNASKKLGITSVVVSSNTVQLIQDILSRAGLKDSFKTIIGFDSPNPMQPGIALNKKPAPDSYLAALSLLKIHANQAVVIEDSALGALAGLRAGCQVIGVSTGGTTFEELEKTILEGGYVIRSLL